MKAHHPWWPRPSSVSKLLPELPTWTSTAPHQPICHGAELLQTAVFPSLCQGWICTGLQPLHMRMASRRAEGSLTTSKAEMLLSPSLSPGALPWGLARCTAKGCSILSSPLLCYPSHTSDSVTAHWSALEWGWESWGSTRVNRRDQNPQAIPSRSPSPLLSHCELSWSNKGRGGATAGEQGAAADTWLFSSTI